MPPKLPACDPCRFSKQSCDHTRPICSRCKEYNREASCVYRSRPFKRRKTGDDSSLQSHLLPPAPLAPISPQYQGSESHNARNKYPNPGYQGSSSHATIFDHLKPEGNDGTDVAKSIADSPYAVRTSHHTTTYEAFDGAQIAYGASLIEQLRTSISIASCTRLIESWTATGVNLALSGCFTVQCAQTAQQILGVGSEDAEPSLEVSAKLFKNSCKPLKSDTTATAYDYCEQNFHGSLARWETLGLFFIAAGRATGDIANFTRIYTTESQRRHFRRTLTHFSDRCLDIALSLDCLNDLQLMLQYENFIMHSYVDGDESYHSWRRLGDVISSVFALGYHEQIENDSGTAPEFLKDLRRAVFARIYSADKNTSIFLGRPPRLCKKYCRFQIPGEDGATVVGEPNIIHRSFKWAPNESFNYMVETRWSAICAMLKEEILDLSREPDLERRSQHVEAIHSAANDQWNSLPPHFRLESSLKHYDVTPILRDFLVSARLNYLHVLFLLRLTMVRRMKEPDEQLIAIAASMLAISVEASLLKDQLAFSGTGLIWRVAYYTLPAAGILCLCLLNRSFSPETSMSQVVQDLSVVVAQAETGSLVKTEDPNYPLLAGATSTIKRILDRAFTSDTDGKHSRAADDQSGMETSPLTASFFNEEEWMPWTSLESWDFETNFWQNLATHPTLLDSNGESRTDLL